MQRRDFLSSVAVAALVAALPVATSAQYDPGTRTWVVQTSEEFQYALRYAGPSDVIYCESGEYHII